MDGEAAELYTGEFLAQFRVTDSAEFDDRQLMRRVEYHNAITEVLLSFGQHYAGHCLTASAVDILRRLLAIDPAYEQGQRMLMTLYVRQPG